MSFMSMCDALDFSLMSQAGLYTSVSLNVAFYISTQATCGSSDDMYLCLTLSLLDVFTHKSLHGLAPLYLSKLLDPYTTQREL